MDSPGKEWFDQQRLAHVERWCWHQLKANLGYASMRDVPPKVLHDWAFEHGLVGFLPACYQDA